MKFEWKGKEFVAASQIANGIQDVPRDEQGKAIIGQNESYFRLKLHDDPLPTTNPNNGLLHFLIDYDNQSKFLYRGNTSTGAQFEFLSFSIESIEVRVSGQKKSILLPSPKSKVILFQKNKLFSVILNNLELPKGDYDFLKVNLIEVKGKDKKTQMLHTISVNNSAFPIDYNKDSFVFNSPFKVEAGKITTLHTTPKKNTIVKVNGNVEYKCELDLDEKGYVMNLPIDKIWINMKSITATRASVEEFVVNNSPTRFELLQLRGTAVILLGNIILPSGIYQKFTFNFDPGTGVELESQNQPLQITNQFNTRFDVAGPFDLRGGRMTEVFLDFDPNLSVFQTLNSGFVMDPDIQVSSVLSFTAEQDFRVVTTLKEYANSVIRDSDTIFQATINSLSNTNRTGVSGTLLPYTNLDLKVVDRLRGTIANLNSFPLSVVGGNAGDLNLKVYGMPSFQQGESFLLFLRKLGTEYFLVNGEMGKITISGSVANPISQSKWNLGTNGLNYYSIHLDSLTSSIPNAKDIVNTSANNWFQFGKSKYAYIFEQTIPSSRLRSLNDVGCNQTTEKELKATTVFGTNTFDPDCTSNVCTFVWTCRNVVLASDIRVNNISPIGFDAQSITNAFGHASGIARCDLGDTSLICQTKLQGRGIPSFGDVSFGLPKNRPFAPTANDASFLQNLYGQSTLPIPTSGPYKILPGEINSIVGTMQYEESAGMTTPDQRRAFGTSILSLMNFAENEEGKTVRDQFDEYILASLLYVPESDDDGLFAQLNALSAGMYVSGKIKEDSQNGLNAIDPSFIDYTISKQSYLRNAILDELRNRGKL